MGCRTVTDCYEWSPETHVWEEASADLNERRWAHIMASVKNINMPGDETRYPLVLGGSDTDTEIYDPVNEEWVPYLELPESNWRTLDCLVQYGDDIYHMRNTFTRCDMGEIAIALEIETSIQYNCSNNTTAMWGTIKSSNIFYHHQAGHPNLDD